MLKEPNPSIQQEQQPAPFRQQPEIYQNRKPSFVSSILFIEFLQFIVIFKKLRSLGARKIKLWTWS